MEVGDGSAAVEMPVNMHAKGHASSSVRRPGEVVVDSVFDDDVVDVSQLQSMEQHVDLTFGDTSVPVTPPMFGPALPATPRQPHATRTHETETEGSPESKKAKVETQKKQRINQLREFHESHIRTVRIGDDEFATLDSYASLGLPCGSMRRFGFKGGWVGSVVGSLTGDSTSLLTTRSPGTNKPSNLVYSPRFACGGRPHRRFISVRERG